MAGSFQRAGARLRVTVQLLEGRDGAPLWAGKVDASMDDVFRMQDEVSRSVARGLEVELGPAGERGRPDRAPAPAPSAEVYELYLRGKLHLLHETLTDFVAAVDWFDKARSADPRFALAWAGLADAYERIAFSFQPEGDWYTRAKAMCEKSLELDPELPEGFYVRSRLHWSPGGGFDHAAAIRDLVAALRARPGLEEAYLRLGSVLYHVGFIEEGLREVEQVLVLSPQHQHARMHKGLCRYHQGRHPEALALALDVAQRAPSSWIHYLTALVQLRLGRLRDAVATAELMTRQVPGEILAHPIRALAAALDGDLEEAARQVELTVENRRAFGHFHHAQYDVACVYALSGRTDDALAWLADAARNGYPCGPFFERDEFLASLRPDPRFRLMLDALAQERAGYLALYRALRATP